MPKPVLLISIFTILLVSCARPRPGSDIIDLHRSWKFRTGDDLQWSSPTLDDNSWQRISAGQLWERQGHEGYDGYAWYRIKVFIPSRLKRNAYFGDSLQFFLGRIDDADQTFLNGSPLGTNGRTIIEPDASFPAILTSGPGTYSISRKYVIPANDPRILWDQENVIAIRVLDTGGGGGLYSTDLSISMTDLKDYVNIDIRSVPFEITGNHYAKTTFVVNKLKNSDIRGEMTIRVTGRSDDDLLYRNSEQITIPAGGRLARIFTFDVPRPMSCRVEYLFKVRHARNTVYATQTTPYILTPPAPQEPRINGPRIFGARPGNPFMYTIPATGRRPMSFEVSGLPYDLSVDRRTGIITGRIYRRGDYPVTLRAINELGTDSMEFTIRIGETIALTPPLGWNSWNVWGLSVDQDKIRKAADLMKSTGLINYGWTYINIDDGWESEERNRRGEIGANDKFPDMPALTEHIHDLGLKAGIYSSPGPFTCGGFPGSFQHECRDATTWARWGFDYLKYDWCSYGQIAAGNSLPELRKPYVLMRSCLDRINRDIVYSLCQYGMGDVWKWGASAGGNLWRTTGDMTDTWESVAGTGFNAYKYSPYAEPGHWNDVDMMVVGWVGWGEKTHPSRLTADEQYTHVSLWSLLSAPMLLGCDLSKLDNFTLNLLTNNEVLAVHQDTLGMQAKRALQLGDLQVWTKPLDDGNIAAGFFNLGNERLQTAIGTEDFGLTGNYLVRDLWRQKDLGRISGSIRLDIPVHGVLLVKFIR